MSKTTTTEKQGLGWYCYICGKRVGGSFYLASMREDTDRVFLVCSRKCKEQLDTETLTQLVQGLLEIPS